MRWSETIASCCRYGDIAERIWGDAEILWEDSENAWQGHATILARMPDGTFQFYEWFYGSCQRCDDWEQRDLSDDAIEAEMRFHSIRFMGSWGLENWFKMILGNDLPEPDLGQREAYTDAGTLIRLKAMAQAYLTGVGA